MLVDSRVEPVDDRTADAEVVLVFGPVAALEQVVDRLTGHGDLAGAEPVLPDADNPARGSCVLHIAEQDATQGTCTVGRRRAASGRFLASVTALWRGDGPAAARPTGRHRARTGG